MSDSNFDYLKSQIESFDGLSLLLAQVKLGSSQSERTIGCFHSNPFSRKLSGFNSLPLRECGPVSSLAQSILVELAVNQIHMLLIVSGWPSICLSCDRFQALAHCWLRVRRNYRRHLSCCFRLCPSVGMYGYGFWSLMSEPHFELSKQRLSFYLLHIDLQIRDGLYQLEKSKRDH